MDLKIDKEDLICKLRGETPPMVNVSGSPVQILNDQ